MQETKRPSLLTRIRRFASTDVALAQHPDKARIKRPATGEVGSTGTSIFGGILQQQDYNADLQGDKLYDVYDRMRKADGQVKAGLSVVKLPLMRADWTIIPGSDSPRDEEIAEFVETDLKNMKLSWGSFLRQALLYLDYGNMTFEKVWEIRDDSKIHLRKLAPRLPRTIMEYRVDKRGGLTGIRQQAFSDGFTSDVIIPVEKLLVFVNEQEGADFRGTSMLRAAYKHWHLKEGLYLVDVIAKEKRGVGVDVATLSENASEEDQNNSEAALQSIHAHDKMWLTEIEGKFKYRIEGIGGGGVLDALGSIEHHDLRILRSILAEFLAMGAGSEGSLAMHKDKSSFFVMALKGVAVNILDTVNKHLIPQWVDYNWPGVEVYPQLTHSRLETRDVLQMAEAVSQLVASGVLTPDRGVEDEFRSIMELPELPEDEGKLRRRFAAPKRTRELAERHVDYAAIEKGLDDAVAKILRDLSVVTNRQSKALVKISRDIFNSTDRSRVDDINVPYKGQLADGIRETLEGLFKQGRAEAETELRKQGAPADFAAPINEQESAQIVKFLGIKAKALANLMADKVKSAVVWELLAQIRAGTFDDGKLVAVISNISDREATKTAGASVSEALNLGRQSFAKQNANLIQHALYSSVLDRGTCSPCEGADGAEFEVESAEAERLAVPYASCDGSGRCRCLHIYILKSEAK